MVTVWVRDIPRKTQTDSFYTTNGFSQTNGAVVFTSVTANTKSISTVFIVFGYSMGQRHPQKDANGLDRFVTPDKTKKCNPNVKQLKGKVIKEATRAGT